MNQAGRRRLLSNVVVVLCGAAVLLALIPLVFVFFYVIKQGFSSLNWDFFTKMPKPVGETGGGMANAMVGSLILIGIASAVAVPVGLIAGVYLSEYSPQAVRVARALHGGRPERHSVDRHRDLRLRPRGPAGPALLGARRRPRARLHDDPDHHADDRGAPEPRSRRACGRARSRSARRGPARPSRSWFRPRCPAS